MNNLTAHIPIPSVGSINTGRTNAHQVTMLQVLGAPSVTPSVDCGEITNARLNRLLVRRDVGPFVTMGLAPAIQSLESIFAAVKAKRPDLYDALGTAGMLCARLVRGSQTNWSNHSWGTAIDLKIDGELVPLGATYAYQGLLDLYPFFHAGGWFWGAGWKRPDPMHFEASDELIREWLAKGLLN